MEFPIRADVRAGVLLVHSILWSSGLLTVTTAASGGAEAGNLVWGDGPTLRQAHALGKRILQR